jgi:O-antigen ligase
MLILAGLLFTYARSAWIGFTGGVMLLLLLRKPLLLAVLPLFIGLVYLLSPDAVAQRILSIFDRKDPTVSERLFFYRSGVAMMRDHPLLGVGPDLANEHYPAYRIPEAPDRPIPHLHSNLIQIGAERGLLGLLAWLCLFGKYFLDGLRAWRRSHRRRDRYIISGALAAVAAMLLAGLFEYNFGDSEIQMMTFLVMSTLYVILKAKERECVDVCDEGRGNAEGGSNRHS